MASGAEAVCQGQAQEFCEAFGRVGGDSAQFDEAVSEDVQFRPRVGEVLVQARVYEGVSQCCRRVAGRVPAVAVERRPRGSVASVGRHQRPTSGRAATVEYGVGYCSPKRSILARSSAEATSTVARAAGLGGLASGQCVGGRSHW